MEAKLLRMADAAKVLSLSRSQIYELARRGAIPTIRLGSSLRVPAAALDQLIEERTSRPAA